ncbi:MAG: OsmC family protein [Sphingomonadaceae bacterium]|nr:OsmC family protein [Sphingomonadaceae bacterium]
MGARRFDFVNAAGRQLSGILETGRETRAAAIFAHCFTCDKTSLAATHVTRALARAGIAVLRFDFTGLGGSGGAIAGLSSDVADLVAAAAAMAEAGLPPRLLVGHSFGGAAVLAAAGEIDSVTAVATLAAPFAAEHVLHQLSPDTHAALAAPGDDDAVPVTIGGRPFTLGRGFIADIREARQDARIAALGRALLVLHAPGDTTVGIDNASAIYAAAKHPKSFVSLDRADHLLRRRADADYAAAVIAAWASRYIDPAEPAATPAVTGVHVVETGGGPFEVRVTAASGSFLADEPAAVGGGGAGPTPYDLLSAALGACTAMTLRLYATRKGWPLGTVGVEVGHTAKTATSRDIFTRRITVDGVLDAEQRTRLLEIADRCPVHRTLTVGAEVTTIHDAAMPVPDLPAAHEMAMDAVCAEG